MDLRAAGEAAATQHDVACGQQQPAQTSTAFCLQQQQQSSKQFHREDKGAASAGHWGRRAAAGAHPSRSRQSRQGPTQPAATPEHVGQGSRFRQPLGGAINGRKAQGQVQVWRGLPRHPHRMCDRLVADERQQRRSPLLRRRPGDGRCRWRTARHAAAAAPTPPHGCGWRRCCPRHRCRLRGREGAWVTGSERAERRWCGGAGGQAGAC